ncbi:glycosyltransferase [Arthrobacter sp. AD-310]
MQDRPEIAAVVVHHRSEDTLLVTISKILSEGVSPHKLVVVDNSEDPAGTSRVEAALPEYVTLISTPNDGYGAAVNYGVRWHAENQTDAAYLLVSTHESLPEAGALCKLAGALEANPQAAVAGPALVTGADSATLWSLGGTFTRILGLPRHLSHRADRAALHEAGPEPVAWLDGAFLLYRKTVIQQHPIDEKFFLYMEETDHHRLLGRLGWKILVEPRAVVWQSSNGVPPYYQTRNIQLFHAKNGNVLQRYASAAYIIIRSIARDLIKKEGSDNWSLLFAGFRDGLRFESEQFEAELAVEIVNPLGGALSHYTKALEALLQDAGASVKVSAAVEPSVSGEGRFAWLAKYLTLLFLAGRSKNKRKVLVVWPVLGFLDIVLTRLLCGDKAVSVVYHDPKPLVRSVGTGGLTAKFVARWPRKAAVIVHSRMAANAMDDAGLGDGQIVLEHPMLPPAADPCAEGAPRHPRPIVRVLGQYKQDRDIEVLCALGKDLAQSCELEVVGRGWPSIAGWKVDARFVPEAELNELIRSSDAVVIPYKRFYQSGIAVRALELGTPIVGRAGTSLSDLYGVNSRLLVKDHEGTDPRAWSLAVKYAIKHGACEARAAADTRFVSVLDDWKRWLFDTARSAR